MATLIQFKRSSTQNDTPSVSDLSLGEFFVNTYHGRFYTEKNDGSASVVEVGSNPATLTVNDAYSFPTSDGSSDQFLKTNGSGTLSFASLGGSGISIFTYTISSTTTAITGSDDNSNTLSYTSGSEQVYINGVKLVSGSDYTATNSSTITLENALSGDVVEVVTVTPNLVQGYFTANTFSATTLTKCYLVMQLQTNQLNLLSLQLMRVQGHMPKYY